jgi:Pyruvate/2-oxoacid:ferredoxin oxidoreductase delta subunit
MKIKRKIIEIDEELCNGCGQCIVDCAEAALEIVDGKAKIVAEKYCDGLGACMGGCPTGALRLVERECDDFDEEAVEEFLKSKKNAETQKIPCGCPSSQIQNFAAAPAQSRCQAANKPMSMATGESSLTHWPVQIRLVPASAPFLKGADLLIAADCTPIVRASFHDDFIAGRVVMMGCPKFDETESYVRKFAEIFATADIKSVTSVIMEVPCCASMRGIIDQAMKQAGKNIPVKEVVLSTRGKILS